MVDHIVFLLEELTNFPLVLLPVDRVELQRKYVEKPRQKKSGNRTLIKTITNRAKLTISDKAYKNKDSYEYNDLVLIT
eukprot:snap_masked-scaffold_44-processed-gene-1.39-mRNA-1 protein AED:1.00 eAED:1.00 QI:0/0/0/0/1/1/2/0/77